MRSGVARALLAVIAAVSGTAVASCGPPLARKPLAMEPIGTVKDVPKPDVDDTPGGTTTPNSGTPNPAKEAACTITDADTLDETLRACEGPMPKTGEIPPIKDKLETKLNASAASTTPGGRLELVLSLHNRTNEPLLLVFTGDPSPHFDVEAIDAKGRRADLPSTKWPGYPKGQKPEARDVKAYRITLEKNGTARLKLGWEAVKTKWAPDKGKSWDGRAPHRAPGPR